MDFNIEHLVLLISSEIVPLKFVSWIVGIALMAKLLAFVGREIQSFSESFSGSAKNFADAYEYVMKKIRSNKNQKK